MPARRVTYGKAITLSASAPTVATWTIACYIGQIFGSTVSAGAAVFVNSNGRLGTMTSSKRFKKDIKPMDHVSEALYSLKPVSFRYKKEIDPAGASQLGLVAEEVEKIDPDLVVRDKEGKLTAFATTR